MSDFAEKVRSIGIIRRRPGPGRTRDVLDARGRAVGKATTDELGNTVTVRDDGQDVRVRPESVTVATSTMGSGR